MSPCALESVSFEDAVRNAVSFGGDADTRTAIAGPSAEAMHGLPHDLFATVRDSHLAETPDIVKVMTRIYETDP